MLCVYASLSHTCLCCAVLCSAAIVQSPGDEPVWRQVLRDQLNHEDPTAGSCSPGTECQSVVQHRQQQLYGVPCMRRCCKGGHCTLQ